jgi:DNA invertase Pin-like site-specific DNA recombinase
LERTNEGRVKAKAEGKSFGRRPKPTAHQRREIVKRIAAGETRVLRPTASISPPSFE